MRTIEAKDLRKDDVLDGHQLIEVVKVGDFRGDDGVSTLVSLIVCVVMRFESDDGTFSQEIRTWFRGDEKLRVTRPKQSRG